MKTRATLTSILSYTFFLISIMIFITFLSGCQKATEPNSKLVQAPVLNPPGGTYQTVQNVQITCATSGATIRYTLDDSEPTTSSTIYDPDNPIQILHNSSITIKAKAFKKGWIVSQTASSNYTVAFTIPDNFIFVPGGTFNNGTSDVTVSSYYIGQFEITQSEYQSVMGSNPSNFSNPNFPVEQVSWFDAIEYCNRRSINEELSPCYSYGIFGTNPTYWPEGWNTNDDYHNLIYCNWTSNGYRLPTEMEWMFAARGGDQTHNYTYSGSNNVSAVAWCYSNSHNSTHTTGTLAANELGIHDMSGNVWEWNWDIYGIYPTGSQFNPHGAESGSNLVLHGGGFNTNALGCTIYYRDHNNATVTSFDIGFRLCIISP